ncbi:DUF3850 domain-containing protein [Lactococcus petauri]|uniref:DUF3850 domain-containing protein n=1 Tax=Lactococcus petauri TaxID=1940789 RepID=UPI00254AA57A|nr:DUF3850 domain-containing protein [Lactococcus petauri]
MKTHELKLDIKYFDEVKNGTKNFEIRKNDRDFKVGDILELKAFKDGFYAKKGSSWHTMGSDCCFYTQQQADTIKVKVKEVIKAEQLNQRDWDDETLETIWNINWPNVMEVLVDYFDTDQMPYDYVLMEVEVVK